MIKVGVTKFRANLADYLTKLPLLLIDKREDKPLAMIVDPKEFAINEANQKDYLLQGRVVVDTRKVTSMKDFAEKLHAEILALEKDLLTYYHQNHDEKN